MSDLIHLTVPKMYDSYLTTDLIQFPTPGCVGHAYAVDQKLKLLDISSVLWLPPTNFLLKQSIYGK